MKGHLALRVLVETLPVSVCSIFVHGSLYELIDLSYSAVVDLDCNASFPDIGEVLIVNRRKCTLTLQEGRNTHTTWK